MTQEELGEAINLSFQQVQKYEAGKNAIASSHIKAICLALQTDANWLFDIKTPKNTKAPTEVHGVILRFAFQLEQLPAAHRSAVLALITALGQS